MSTKSKSNGRQRCGRCHKDLTLGSFSPSRRGKPGKWCRACFKVYRAEKKGAKKSTSAKTPPAQIAKVIKKLKSRAPRGVHATT
jgi:hypothetical protein